MKTLLLGLWISLSCWADGTRPLVVGSKKFTESVILGELCRYSLQHEGLPVEHKPELGGTRILWNALLNGDIDIFADYTGTVTQEILKKTCQA